MIKTDRRARRTRAAISEAFIKLLTQKEISKITVREITELADINRATFYLHYTDVYQVLEEIENELASSFFELVDKYDLKELIHDPYPILKAIGDGIEGKPLFAKFVLNSATSSNYFMKIKTELKRRIITTYDTEVASELYYALTFIIAGTLDSYEEWFENNKPIPLETLCKNTSKFISGGVKSIIGEI